MPVEERGCYLCLRLDPVYLDLASPSDETTPEPKGLFKGLKRGEIEVGTFGFFQFVRSSLENDPFIFSNRSVEIDHR